MVRNYRAGARHIARHTRLRVAIARLIGLSLSLSLVTDKLRFSKHWFTRMSLGIRIEEAGDRVDVEGHRRS